MASGAVVFEYKIRTVRCFHFWLLFVHDGTVKLTHRGWVGLHFVIGPAYIHLYLVMIEHLSYRYIMVTNEYYIIQYQHETNNE